MKINETRCCEGMQAGEYNVSGYSSTSQAGFPGYEMNESMPGVVCPPIYECPRETVCHRYICHEVPQE